MLDILAEFLAEYPPYNKIRDYLAIRKDELKEEAFEKFYKTLIVDFINWQPGYEIAFEMEHRAIEIFEEKRDDRSLAVSYRSF